MVGNRRVAQLVAAFVVTMVSGTALAGMTLEELTAAVSANVTSITSITARFSIAQADENAPSGFSGPFEYEWAEEGPRKAIVSLASSDAGQNQLISFDGERGFTFNFGGREKPRLRITDSINRAFASKLKPAFAMGLRVQGTVFSLPELMAAAGANLVGSESVAGVEYWTIDVPEVESTNQQGLHLSAVIDGGHGFLPKKVAIHEADGQHPERHQIWEVEEFVQVDDPVTHGARWVPRRMVFKQPGPACTLVIHEMTINEPVAAHRFRPTPPAGTSIVDVSAGSPPGGRFEIVGGPDVVDTMVQSAARAANAAVVDAERNTARVDASTPRRAAVPRLVFWASMAAVVVGIAIWARRKLKARF